MNRKTFWSPAAEQDLENILDYLKFHWNTNIIQTFLQKLDNAISQIENDSKLSPIINKQYGIRKCVITKQNTLFYRESIDSIEIVRLFDSRQDPQKLTFET